MSSRYDPKLYRPSSFDDDMCLKPPTLLWLAVLYLSRAVLLPIGFGIGHVVGLDQGTMAAIRPFWRPEALVPAAVSAPVFYALLRRSPAAPDVARWIWVRGRMFLGASAVLDAGLSFFLLMDSAELTGQPMIPLTCAVIDIYFALYIFLARRVRDTFADFPPPTLKK